MSDFGLSSTISTWGNVLTDYYGTKFEKQENELAYERYIAERDYMNQYNSPKSQMERLKQAGLNPNLMYGQGTMGEQKSMPTYQPTKAKASQKRIDPLDIATIAQAKKTKAEADGIALDNQYKKETMIDRVNIKDQEFYKNHWSLNEIINKGLVQEMHAQEIQQMQIRTLRNEMSKSDFEAWLSNKKMNKNDSLIARKAFEYAEKMGVDKKLHQMYLDRYNQ